MLIGLVGAWAAVVVWGGVDANLGIVNVHASVRPALIGGTVLRLPPLGAVSARTHFGPARIDLSVDQVHIKETAQWLKLHKSPNQTAAVVQKGIQRAAYRLAWLAVVVAAVGGFIACVLLKVKGRHVWLGTVIGALGVALPLALAALTYNPVAFENPSFEGEMSSAPRYLDVAQEAWQSNSKIMQDIPRIASRTVALYQRLGYGQADGAQGSYCVLLISDLHNNPIAARFALDLADTYKPDLVLIAGDFTDLGHPLEAELLAGLRKFEIPMLGVAGNHDSRATIRALNSIPNLTMLDNGKAVREGPLTVAGFGDPASTRADMGSVNTSHGKLGALSRRVIRRVGQATDILLIHNNDVARDAGGHVPVIAEGHLHQAFVASRHGSILVNPGTTGAAGLRYFSAKQKPSYTAAVLRFSTDGRPRLRSVDSIRMEMPSGDFAVTRQSVSPSIGGR